MEIDPANKAEDKKLGLYAEMASNLIEEFLNRPGMSYKSRTEYYDGTGTQKILLKSRPVYLSPTPQVFVDEAGYYGAASGTFLSSTELTYGSDFALVIDQEDGSSRSGILLRLHSYWPRPQVRTIGLLSPYLGQNFGGVKVIYQAGYLVDNLPPAFRLAANTLVARLRYIFPLGMMVSSESYEERSISLMENQKDYLLGLIKPMLLSYKNWSW